MTDKENPSVGDPGSRPIDDESETDADIHPTVKPILDDVVQPDDTPVAEVSAQSPVAPPEKFVISDAGSTPDLASPPMMRQRYSIADQPNIELFLANSSANGGAVGAMALGVMTIAGAFLTPWSACNGLIGIGMGIWGLKSPKKRMSFLGISLCIFGVGLCLAPIQEGIDLILDEYLFRNPEISLEDP